MVIQRQCIQWTNCFHTQTLIRCNVQCIMFRSSNTHTISKISYIWFGNTVRFTITHRGPIPTGRLPLIMFIPFFKLFKSDVVHFTNVITVNVPAIWNIDITEVFGILENTHWIITTFTIIGFSHTNLITFGKQSTIKISR